MVDLSKYMATEDKRSEEMPFIGVSIITVNSGRNLKWMQKCIRSVMCQETEVPIEHIIVNNVDNSKSLAECYNDGMASARTAFIYILDDDDELHPKAIDESVKAMMELKQKDLMYYRVSSYQMLITETGEPIGTTTFQSLGLLDRELVKSFGGFAQIRWKEYTSPLVPTPKTMLLARAEQEGLKSAVLKSHLYAKRVHRSQMFFHTHQKLYESVLWNLEQDKHMSEDGSKLTDYEYNDGLPEDIPGFLFEAPRRNVAVGIVTNNNVGEIEKCLINISKYSPNETTVMVYDNKSRDRTKKVVERTFKKINMRGYLNIGEEVLTPAKTYNQLIDAFLFNDYHDYLVLLSPDIYVTPYWIDYMIDAFERNTFKGCGIVGVQESNINGKIEHNFVAKTENEYPRNKYEGITLNWNAIGITPKEFMVPAVKFSCVIISRRVLEKVRFDEKYEIEGFENLDFCLQAVKEGFTIWTTPYVEVMDYSKSSTKEENKRTDEEIKKDYDYFVSKWGADSIVSTDVVVKKLLPGDKK